MSETGRFARPLFLPLSFSFLILLQSISATPAQASFLDCESLFGGSRAKEVAAQTASPKTSGLRKVQQWKTDGIYTEAPLSAYKAYFEQDTTFKMPDKLGVVGEKDIAVNLIRSTREQIQHLIELGRWNANRLHYSTSAAGAWTRGRGRLKGLQPYNVEELVTPQEFKHLTFIDQVLEKAGDPKALMEALGVRSLPKRMSGEQWADKTVEKLIEEESTILTRAMTHKRALNPLDLKFATVALASQRSGAYITFDVWLSLKTHPEVGEYIRWFARHSSERVFHTDLAVDIQIKRALKSYFAESAARGETHVFGYQEGFYGMDKKTGAPLRDTDLLGEGTGMLPIYYERSGRLAELKAMGKEFMIFDNIETLTDILLISGSHISAGKPISSVLVPESDGYKGGKPFLMEIDGQLSVAMIEKDILSKEQQELLPKGGEYFFSGTLVTDFTAVSEKRVITESKKYAKGGQYDRLKYMIQDATQFTPAAAILGPTPAMELTNGAGPVYENFKYLHEFYRNGLRLLERVRFSVLQRDAR